jgi:ammonium transporter Rh
VIDIYKPPPPVYYGRLGELMFTLAQVVVIVLFATCTKFGDYASVSSTVADEIAKDHVQQYYPFFQDVHVMIFVGFGFLMTFVKTHSWGALCFNWIVSCWALQWGILSYGFWTQIIEGKEMHKIELGIENLIIGDFGAGVAMITFGAILGKANLQQLLFLVFWEMIFWGLNGAICEGMFHVKDVGGSMMVHTFGAYYGLAASYFFQPNRAHLSNNMKSSY